MRSGVRREAEAAARPSSTLSTASMPSAPSAWPCSMTGRENQNRYIPVGVPGDRRTSATPDPTAVARRHSERALEFLRQGGDSFLTTKVDTVLNWSRKY